MTPEKQLRERLATLSIVEDLFDDVGDVVFFVKDKEGRYVVVNRTLATRCGCARRSDVIGKTAAELFPPPFGASYLEQDRHVLQTGERIKDKLELQTYTHGELGWCLTNKIPIRDENGAIVGMTGLSRDLHIPKARGEHLQEIAGAVDHISLHYGDPLRVEDLAKMISLSVYQFEQRMKKVFQLTAGQFIMHTRITAARHQLRNTSGAIADIAVACGFYDQSAFARQFKAVTGLTPSEFRSL